MKQKHIPVRHSSSLTLRVSTTSEGRYGQEPGRGRKAVKCGYWHLWRYNPALEAEGKNPFTLDSKEPDWSGFQDFLKGEVRYASVMKQYPQEADELFKAAEENAKWRYNSYKRLSKENWGAEVTE